jgi:transcriptional regulator with XRE-family HTH domain
MPEPESSAGSQRHVLRWVRERLGLTQFDVARMTGTSQPTIQSVELGRLKLSERLAYKLGARLGVDPKWLLANDWQKLPEPEDLRESFKQAIGFDTHPFFEVAFLRGQLLRGYLLQRAIIDELGWQGSNAAGFHETFHRAELDLLSTIANKKLRDQIYQKYREETNDVVENMNRVISDAKAIKQSFKEWRAKDEADRATPSE